MKSITILGLAVYLILENLSGFVFAQNQNKTWRVFSQLKCKGFKCLKRILRKTGFQYSRQKYGTELSNYEK